MLKMKKLSCNWSKGCEFFLKVPQAKLVVNKYKSISNRNKQAGFLAVENVTTQSELQGR